nr:MAG: hypothetical protein [Chemarfal virus 263]
MRFTAPHVRVPMFSASRSNVRICLQSGLNPYVPVVANRRLFEFERRCLNLPLLLRPRGVEIALLRDILRLVGVATSTRVRFEGLGVTNSVRFATILYYGNSALRIRLRGLVYYYPALLIPSHLINREIDILRCLPNNPASGVLP